MTEPDIQADYTRKVAAARVGFAKALETRIANLKAERNRALELIREGEKIDHETEQIKAVQRDEGGGSTPQGGNESPGSPESGLEDGKEPNPEAEAAEQGQDPPQDPPQE